MSDPLGDPPSAPLPNPSPSDEDALNLLDDAAEPTDDSPTVISKTPAPSVRAEEGFSGSLRGRRLAHFELLEPIGVGGMAAVLRARDTQLDRLVALKILPPEMAADPENIRRFHQEARSAAKLDHENIARVFFCGEDQRLQFIAFEFVEGENLRTILEKRGRLPAGEALHYMLQVAAGLAHASHRGVVHRDIKPSNIIITPNGRAKLVDMGLARSLEPHHDQGLTQSGVTLGTFDYISPEQALEPREADVRSDIYSLGCTFYHMLTGHPPVPEGTAAKKLHHHQHVKPPDPRRLVADLPDEAAVILDRMMAKHPKDRYQTPEQLVHHLYLAARKLGVAEVPEGVLAVEAALPAPPAGRPLVLAVLAAVAVVALIFFLDPPSPPAGNPPPNPQASRSDDAKDKPPSPSVEGTGPASHQEPKRAVADTPLPKPDTPVFNPDQPTAPALAKFLEKNKEAPKIEILLAGDLNLLDSIEPDLIVSNPSVTIRPRDAHSRPTIRYDYHDRTSSALQASLTIQSKECTVEGIRFVMYQKAAAVPMAGLWFRGGNGMLTVKRCQFIQADPDTSGSEKNRMASVLVESRESTSLILSESCFLGFASLGTEGSGESTQLGFKGAGAGGQYAVARRGSARIEASNCLFGPHAAVFRLEGNAAGEEGLVRLNHCSVLAANQSAVYDLTEGADARIEAEGSLFARPGDASMTGMVDGKGAVLLRRASAQGKVDYNGRSNRYHQLDKLLVVANASDDTVQSLLKQMKLGAELSESPWKDPQPLSQLEQLHIQAAFQVNPRMPELRVPAEDRNGQLIGAERVLAFSYLDDLPRLTDGPSVPPSQRELIVEKAEKLGHVLLDAKPGDVLLLRVNGEVKLEPLSLSGPRLADLTLRAAKGFHPILTLSEPEDDTTASLFHVANGKLRLEGLEVRLRASDDFASQAVVSFAGDGECTLKDCLITLDRAGRTTALAVALLTEKRLKKSAQAPRFTLENCFVRGKGDLVFSRGGQPAEVTVTNSLIALTGSLLNVEGDKDVPAPAGVLLVRLKRTTTYLMGHLIRLRAGKDLKSLAKIQCEPESCLFAPAADRALVHLEGPENEELRLAEKLAWASAGKNAYGCFTTLFERQLIGGTMMKMPNPSRMEEWKKDISGESDSEYNVKLLSPSAVEAAGFPRLLPSAFRTEDSLKEYGVDRAVLRHLAPIQEKSEMRKPKDEAPEPDSE